MRANTLFLIGVAAALAGCSGSSGLSTGSIAGTGAPPAPVNDVTARAMQVGGTSARATKCGYNFDPAKLRANFIASEAQINPADSAKAEKIYDIAHNGVIKAVATKSDYCSQTKTAEIKEDLNRHLAGDFTPRPPKVEPQEPSFWDKIGDGNGQEKGPAFGTSDWWDSQAEKKGG